MNLIFYLNETVLNYLNRFVLIEYQFNNFKPNMFVKIERSYSNNFSVRVIVRQKGRNPRTM